MEEPFGPQGRSFVKQVRDFFALPNLMAHTSRNCQRREENGKIVNVATNEPFTYDDACMELGSIERYDKAATEAAQAAVKKFLTEVFGLN
ncbi:hypothetical protein N8E89_21250 (plasmid) [Phyllobacterium sp. A18/5-2]|uniref:hypothetical protein n=1 Tax=Phyllobacterium sp. A18/5-2 TaxID=2978392 RepID=UPI0021C62637|nr:hypothetical protein [Phyllobacterium sp. A18/5-2]UXN67059.1 hypothetical protein N8E89_21250 [Phyllobacterium sp. A18/5-2]